MSDTDLLSAEASEPRARQFGFINWMGLWTLYKKECLRFLRIFPQTLLAPIISNLLYMTVFVLAFAALRDNPEEFMMFLAPGLVMLGILNNASSNSSSSVMQGKIMGNIVDLLVTPLAYYELAIGWIGGAATRGILVAIVTALALSIFVPLIPLHIWAPLSFLSGTFYKIDVLPQLFQDLIQFNPLFYLIDGFRYGFLGEADSNIAIGVAFISALNIGKRTRFTHIKGQLNGSRRPPL